MHQTTPTAAATPHAHNVPTAMIGCACFMLIAILVLLEVLL